jgi:hypothetical protein
MNALIPCHIAAEMVDNVTTGLGASPAALRVWVDSITKGDGADARIAELQEALLAEQLAHAKHKELLRKIAHCSDVFADFRKDIWSDLRDFYRENC